MPRKFSLEAIGVVGLCLPTYSLAVTGWELLIGNMGRGVAFQSLMEGTEEVGRIGRVFTLQVQALVAETLNQWEVRNCR